MAGGSSPRRRGDSLVGETFFSRKPALIRDYANYAMRMLPTKRRRDSNGDGRTALARQ